MSNSFVPDHFACHLWMCIFSFGGPNAISQSFFFFSRPNLFLSMGVTLLLKTIFPFLMIGIQFFKTLKKLVSKCYT
jgi:hypothetical protein